MKYWLIAIAIIIIVACLIYSNINVIEGLGENSMTKYYEDTTRIDNMLRMITMKITELRMKIPDNYVSMLTPDNVNNLEAQRKTALEELTKIQTKTEEQKGEEIELTPEQKKEEQSKIEALNQTIDEITDAKSIIRLQSQQDYLNNAKKITANQYDIYYFKNKIELIKEELDSLSEQKKAEKQTEIDNYERNIQIAEVTITKLEIENNA